MSTFAQSLNFAFSASCRLTLALVMSMDSPNTCWICSSSEDEFKVLELYSGIGGTRQAIKDCRLATIGKKIRVTSVDINTNANMVYEHNFKECKVLAKNIVALSPEDVDKGSYDLLTMSPPCQPFTRRDLKDNRCDSFIHLISDVFPKLVNPPKHIFMENVKGFEESKARQVLLDSLALMGYDYEEYLLTPVQLHIPNSRLRYYLIAKQNMDSGGSLSTLGSAVKTLPPAFTMSALCNNCKESYRSSHYMPDSVYAKTVGKYLESHDDISLCDLMLPDDILRKFGTILDIVDSKSEKSCCFTRAYGHYVHGTGSLLMMNGDISGTQVLNTINSWTKSESISDEQLNWLKSLKLRYFSPKEVANLMCFPADFCMPSTLSLKQKYKLLGNSVNVAVVSTMLKHLLFDKLDK